jgi:hypothetical protein
MKISVLAGVGATLLAVGACAPVDEPSRYTSAENPTRCFTGAEIDNFRVAGESQIYVHSRRGHAYRLDAAPNCFSSSTNSVTVKSAAGASNRICPGDDAEVVAMNGSIPKTCIARVSGPITDSAVSGFPG